MIQFQGKQGDPGLLVPAFTSNMGLPFFFADVNGLNGAHSPVNGSSSAVNGSNGPSAPTKVEGSHADPRLLIRPLNLTRKDRQAKVRQTRAKWTMSDQAKVRQARAKWTMSDQANHGRQGMKLIAREAPRDVRNLPSSGVAWGGGGGGGGGGGRRSR